MLSSISLSSSLPLIDVCGLGIIDGVGGREGIGEETLEGGLGAGGFF